MSDTVVKKLGSAVEESLSLIDAGESPRSAIAKVATAKGLTSDQVTRVCQLYNRSAAITQRLGADTLEAKLGEAVVVDPREVLLDVTARQTPKTASSPTLTAVSSLLTKLSRQESKVANIPAVSVAIIPEAKTAADPTCGIHHGVSGVEFVELHRSLAEKQESLESKIASLFDRIEVSLHSAESAVSRIASRTGRPMGDIEAFRYVLARKSAEMRSLGDVLVDRVITTVQRAKLADFVSPPDVINPDVANAVTKVAEVVSAISELKAKYPELQYKLAALREEAFIVRTRSVGDRVINREINLSDTPLVDQQMEHIHKVASTMTAWLGSSISEAFNPFGADKSDGKAGVPLTGVDKFQIKLRNPQHESNLAAIRSRRALQELLVDDPVVSSAPEEDVINAFNEISAHSPQIVETPATLRAVLRQYLQNNSSPFDLAQARSLERVEAAPKAK